MTSNTLLVRVRVSTHGMLRIYYKKEGKLALKKKKRKIDTAISTRPESLCRL